jgi:cytochrome P450
MGSRTCIGKHISMLEMSKLVPQMVRNFNFELDEDLQREGLKSLNRSFVKQQNFRGKVFARAGEKG